MRSAAIITALLCLSLTAIAVHAAEVHAPYYTVEEANAIISNATLYVNGINQSSYLIFYPNLTASYAYLSKARLIYKDSPSSAIFYANKATYSAYSAYTAIGYYRYISAALSALFAAVFAGLLYKLMKPVRKYRKGKKQKQKH